MNLLSQLPPNALVLTPNRRLASFVQAEYANYKQQQGQHAWESLDVLPIKSWLTRCWDESLSLLSDVQEKNCWDSIIRKSPQSQQLLNLNETTQAVQNAWQLLNEWDLAIDEIPFSTSEDHQSFKQWALSFKKHCQQNNFITQCEIANYLVKKQHTAPVTSPTVYLIGFDALTPQLEKLFKHWKLETKTLTFNRENKKINRLALHDKKAEIETAANWASQLVKAGKSNIAIVDPNLTDNYQSINRIFKIYTNQFSISGGVALNSTALVHTALLLLKLNEEQLSISEISQIVRSPFIAKGQSSLSLRAATDATLRSLQQHVITIKTASNLFDADLKQNLQQFKALNSTATQTPSQWATIFSQQLASLGWPGERALNSEEYQIMQSWKAVLTEFAALDMTCNSIDCAEAQRILRQCCQQSLFQAQSEQTPIQVLGLLEAAGLPFDHFWLLGLDDSTLPAAPQANPFLPISLQREKDMPHASAKREMRFGQKLLAQFQGSATEIIISYPEWEQDRQCLPSPLLKNFEKIQTSDLQLAANNSLAATIYESRDLEIYEDHLAPAISPNETIKGGTFIFKQQAACPFRAFAEFRLQAKTLDTPKSGLDALDRGLVLHNALENIWQSIEDQKSLIELSPEQLQQKIELAVNAALSSLNQTLSTNWLAIEQQRLGSTLQRWLSIEMDRPEFRVVEREKRQQLTLAGICINMQVDRIDELAGGMKIIIDYKTGIPNVNAWFGQRPDEPQLPMYCIASDDKINGIVFGQVRAGDMRLKGVSQDYYDIPGVLSFDKLRSEEKSESWSSQLEDWFRTLENLGQQFQSGFAAVDPKNPGITCQHCDLQPLCRV